MSESQESSDNQPRSSQQNMDSLLRLCLQNSAPVESEDTNVPRGLDENRREWLNEVISSLPNAVQQMKNFINEVSLFLAKRKSSEENIDENEIDHVEEIIDELIDLTGNIDNAMDFHKIGGYKTLLSLLETNDDRLQAKTCELIGELSSNNVYCQEAAIDESLLPHIIDLLDNDLISEIVQVKSLYALSSLIRGNDKILEIFETKYDGLSLLLRALQRKSDSNKLRMKVAFLLVNLCQQQPKFRETTFNMGYIEQLIALLHHELEASHEYLFQTLYLIIEHDSSYKTECRRSELNLETLLKNRLKEVNGLDEYRELEEHCLRLLEACFNESCIVENEDR